LLYLGQGRLADGQLPRRTKIADLVMQAFIKEMQALEQELKDAKGRVSFTSDMWSRQNLEGYMAVTAHY
ncbi:hypothetical protein PENSPDRAFT_554771, partial [Peniophora sp. CONT]